MKFLLLVIILSGSLFISCDSAAQATQEQFKEAFVKRLQSLKPSGYEKRTVKIVQVTTGKSNSGTTHFKVTAYIHDVDNGYPPNKYYGQTCVGKMDNWPFTMHKDDFDEWKVQGAFTVLGNECKANVSEGSESISVDALPGSVYVPGNKPAPAKNLANKKPTLYIGEYAAYGTGGTLMAGMGMILLPGNRYYDLDKKRGGTYTFNAQAGTIKFNGGFLGSLTGKNVGSNGFDISATVHYEPWR